MDEQLLDASNNLEIIPILYHTYAISSSAKGQAGIGPSNKLSCGLKYYENVKSYTIRVCNFDSKDEYVLSFDPDTFFCTFEAVSTEVEARSLVKIEKTEEENPFYSIKLAKYPRYLRHSDLKLRFDPPGYPQGCQFELDATWIIRVSRSRFPAVADFRSTWPMMHVRNLVKSQSGDIIRQFMEIANFNFRSEKRSRHDPSVYNLQGAGGVASETGETAQGLAFKPPGLSKYGEKLKRRVEAAGTVRSRGGVERFANFTGDAEIAMIDLIWFVKRAIVNKKYFHKDNILDNAEIGFIELIHQQPHSVITPHCDGASDCDFAANFALHGSAYVTVGRKRFLLNPGDVYIFRPHQQLHSVEAPLDDVLGRFIVSIRFFFTNSLV